MCADTVLERSVGFRLAGSDSSSAQSRRILLDPTSYRETQKIMSGTVVILRVPQ